MDCEDDFLDSCRAEEIVLFETREVELSKGFCVLQLLDTGVQEFHAAVAQAFVDVDGKRTFFVDDRAEFGGDGFVEDHQVAGLALSVASAIGLDDLVL